MAKTARAALEHVAASPDEDALRQCLRLLEAKRHALADLVAAGELDDAQMWRLQETLDQEEFRLYSALRR